MSKESVYDAIQILDNRSISNKKQNKQSKNQRRNIVIDNFGNEFQRQGDATHPATFYVSLSNDMTYLERYQFKLVMQPFAQPMQGNGATGNRSLTIGNASLATNGTTISPNPHSHSLSPNPHNHSIDPGISLFDGTATDFEIWIEGINVTDYLKAQWDGQWITSSGIFPNGNNLDAYDLLAIEGYLPLYDGSQDIYTPGYKTFEIRGNGTFNCVMYLYLKYSFTNR